jgi:hypothetical protein
VTNPAPPQPRTFGVNEVQVAAYLNSVRDALLFLANPPVCNAVQATFQSIPTGTSWTSLAQDSTAADPYGMHSNTTNNSRATSQAAGYYMVFAAAAFASNATGWRGARVAKNGASVAGGATEIGTNPAGVTAISSPPVITYLNVGDYVESQGLQTSGGSLNSSVNSDADCSLTAQWVHA